MNMVLALLRDAYRELNAKRLFWVSLAVSALVVAAFAAVALGPDGVTFFGLRTPWEFGTSLYTPAAFYKLVYVTLGITYWLTWAAMILAVMSTAGIFPDFLASGSVDLYLARPVSRLKLFLLKYLFGLLFVTLQAAVFSVASFIVIGLRGGVWEPGLLLAVPLVALMFSYLFAVCTFIGVLTRSTIAALVVTLLAWMVMAGLQATERGVLSESIVMNSRVAYIDRQIARLQEQIDHPPLATIDSPASAPPQTQPGASAIAGWARSLLSIFNSPPPSTAPQNVQHQLDTLRSQEVNAQANLRDMNIIYRIIYPVEAVLPKTSETVALLQRKLLTAANLPRPPEIDDAATTNQANFRQRRMENQYATASVELQLRQRSLWWVLGTSLGFEVVLVGAAAWVFCRRDY